MMLELDDDDLEETLEGSGSWVTDPTGTIRHLPTKTSFSEKKGITVEGQAYQLGLKDIKFDPDGFLGAGACGSVQRATIIKTGQVVAVKGIRIEGGPEKKAQLLKEVKSLVVAEWCPNLVTWYGGFVGKSIVHVVLELMDLGSLKSLGKRHPTGMHAAYLAYISAESTRGLEFLHGRNIMHRDIKPDNILHNRAGEVKLTDFGIARELTETIGMAGTFVGTQIYMAPEMCLGEGYNFAVDLWSYGLVLYELATGKFPFPPLSTFPELFQCICEDPEPRLCPAQYHPLLCDFAATCLTREWDQRGDATRLLRHAFVTVGPEPDPVPTTAQFADYLARLP